MQRPSITCTLLASILLCIGAGCQGSPTPSPEPLPAPAPIPAPVPPASYSSSTQNRVMTREFSFPGILPEAETAHKQIRIKTTKGNIVFELLPNEGPRAASNFVYLAGKKFYDGLIFHRVEPGFVIQGGDPLGQGFGGPGYQFEDDPVHVPYKKGTVAMANAGHNTNGSQFFIMLDDAPFLSPDYSVFGRVIQGQEVVDAIEVGDAMLEVVVESKK